ncbi:hypothetical protein [Nostoc sp.]|uniref:hypothetical protein n=1 Tax=Nostoc sp. TaxID=1180 RepID=UPI002FF7289B
MRTSVNTKAEIECRHEDEIKAIVIAFDKFMREKYSTLESLRTHMTPYNKVIKAMPLVASENAYYYEKHNGELFIFCHSPKTFAISQF